MQKPIETSRSFSPRVSVIAFCLGVMIGTAFFTLGESELIMPMGISQAVADGRYLIKTGDTVTGNLAVDGNTTLGDAAGKKVTSNADRWSWSNPTTFDFDDTIVLNATKGATCKGTWTYANDLIAEADAFFYGGTTVFGNNPLDDFFFYSGTGWIMNPLTLNVDGNWTIAAAGFQILGTGDNFSWTGPFIVSGNFTTTEYTSFGNGAGDTHAFVGDSFDGTGVTDFTVPLANAGTEALHQNAGDARYQALGSIKSGTVAGATFAGNPKIFTVTFNTAFPDTNYAVTITAEDNRTFTFQTKLAGSFVMNSNANLALVGDVDWTATAHSDP